MARIARLIVPKQVHHVIQRGNNRQAIFFDEEDFEFYLELLREQAALFQCLIHAYVLMTNHVHLLVTPLTSDGVSLLMQFIGRRYVRYINKKYGRSGTLWEGRFRASLVDSEAYLFVCMRYIELNPVRARMVRRPESYAWSSHQAHIGAVIDSILTPHELYTGLGRSIAKRQKAYKALFSQAVPQDDLNQLRNAVKGGWVTGSDDFKKKMSKKLAARVEPQQRGGDRKSEKFRQSR